MNPRNVHQACLVNTIKSIQDSKADTEGLSLDRHHRAEVDGFLSNTLYQCLDQLDCDLCSPWRVVHECGLYVSQDALGVRPLE